MPHRRRVKSGSFGSHFDDLVKHFRHHQDESKERQASASNEPGVHDRLFQTSWRKSREAEAVRRRKAGCGSTVKE